MTRMLFVVGVFLVVSSAALAAPADITRLPAGYQPQIVRLTPSCGADRAQTIANLSWDIDIHADWLRRVKADPSLAKQAGSASWHGYWISVYRHTIALLERDCAAPVPSG